jgi:hypothetical protein
MFSRRRWLVRMRQSELRILKVDFKQPFISYGQDLATTCLMALLPMYSRLPVGG